MNPDWLGLWEHERCASHLDFLQSLSTSMVRESRFLPCRCCKPAASDPREDLRSLTTWSLSSPARIVAVKLLQQLVSVLRHFLTSLLLLDSGFESLGLGFHVKVASSTALMSSPLQADCCVLGAVCGL